MWPWTPSTRTKSMKDNVKSNGTLSKAATTAGMIGRNNGIGGRIDKTKMAITTASSLQNINNDNARPMGGAKNKTSAEIISETKSMLANGKCLCV